MGLKFSKKSDRILRTVLVMVGLGVVGGASTLYYATLPTTLEPGYQPQQPVPYSHKLHAGNMGMDCTYCHTSVLKAAYASIPPTQTCMNCHSKVKEKSLVLEPVRASWASGESVPWIKVHRLPDYVFFNHSAHTNAGVSCVSCHGRVDQMVEVKQVQTLAMSWCLDCHRNPAPNLRPTQFVTKLDWKPEGDPAALGREIIAQKGINPPVNCSGCHR
jgi:menaquinone reductase, multiheme cytochrome c subunit